jgi:hypothetical protein
MFRYMGESPVLKGGTKGGTPIRRGEAGGEPRRSCAGPHGYCLGVVGERSSGAEGES